MMEDAFEYDVALSFAGEDRAIAQNITTLLEHRNISVFHDEYLPAAAWGEDVVDHLVNLYARKARYCVLLISQYYPMKQWTALDRRHAQERSFRDADEYVLLVQLDEHEIPGMQESKGYRDLRQHTIDGIADWIATQLAQNMPSSAPPPQSHDLRSGNLPSTSSQTDHE